MSNRKVQAWQDWWKEWGLEEWPAYNLATGHLIMTTPSALPQQYGFGFPDCEHAAAWSFEACEECAQRLLVEAKGGN